MNERLEVSTKHGVLALVAALALLAGLPGCARHRADAAPAPPPAPIRTQAPAAEPPPGPLSEPQTRAELPTPQAVPEGAAPDPRGPFANHAPEAPEQPAEPPTAKAPVRTVAEAPSASAATPSEPQQTSSVPQLGPLISDEQREIFQNEIDRNLDLTRASLDALMGRRLTADQAEGVRRIREFIRQVEESRGTDAALARNLSERARLLAEDLVRNTR